MDWDFIHTYTRAEAIADGVLFNCPDELLKANSIKYPTALSSALYESIKPTFYESSVGQGLTQRLNDLLGAFKAKAKQSDGSEMLFEFPVMRDDEKGPYHEWLQVKAVIGPGDDPEPVITVMLPDED